MVAEEDAEKAAAELRERLKEYERCVTWVTGKERRWYAGPTGHARRAYDIRLFELRQEYPVVSLRSLGRLLKAYYAKHLPNAPGSGCVPYCRRSEAMACERMGILLIRMAEYRRGER
jgi:hypothetical protein